VLKTIELQQGQDDLHLDLLGEAVITEAEAQSYLDRYLELMAQLVEAAKTWTPIAAMDQTEADNVSRVQVSVKLTAFYLSLTLWMLR